jgi:hypothetical protein
MRKVFLAAVALVGMLGATATAQNDYSPGPVIRRPYYHNFYDSGFSAAPFNWAYGYGPGFYQQMPGGYSTWNGPVHPTYRHFQGMYSPSPPRVNRPSGYGISP